MKQCLMPVLLLLLAFPLVTTDLIAQNEVEREQRSLDGLQEFGFTVNIEGSLRIADDTTVTPTNIRQQAISQIVDANLRYVADEEVESSADIPFLHMHINMMELDNGLIPFSIDLRLYQPVKLVLNRDLQTSASTWESSMVGIVSFDRLGTVKRAAENMMVTFLEEYRIVNQREL